MALISNDTWREAQVVAPFVATGDVYAAYEAGKKAGAAEECEACAKIAEEWPIRSQWDLDHFQEDMAAAIRARRP